MEVFVCVCVTSKELKHSSVVDMFKVPTMHCTANLAWAAINNWLSYILIRKVLAHNLLC